ncbi:MAG: molybdenum cofactor biosynthesis protein MoaE [Aeromicrobium sp.]
MTSATSNMILRANVESEPIDVSVLEALVENHSAGAYVTFVGKVRRRDGGREVDLLEYSSHPSADAEAHRIAGEVLASADGVHAIACSC